MSAKSNPRSIIHTVPLFRVAALFLLGIVIGDLCDGLVGFRSWLLIGVAVAACSLVLYKVNTTLCNQMIFFSAVVAGGLRMSSAEDNRGMIEGEGTIECKIAVLSEPIVRGKVVQFDAKVDGEGVLWQDGVGCIYRNKSLAGKKLRISLLRDTITGYYKDVNLGDGLVARVDLSPLKEWHRQNAHFDYIRWLKARDFVGRGFVGIGKWKKTDLKCGDIGVYDYIRVNILRCREVILEEIKMSGMDDETFAVASAMALGNKSNLTPELRDEYTIAGAAHILALSGVHLAIIYMILSFLFGNVRKREKICVLTFIWVYVFFVGMPISVVRAACMLTIWDFLYMMEKHQRQLNVYGLTLLVMIVVSPESVWDVGFQMSFIAVLAIILFMKPINDLMPEKWKPKNKKEDRQLSKLVRQRRAIFRTLWYIGSASCAAQVGTAPLVAYYFGRVTVLFLITNFVVVPLSWIIIFGTLLMAFVVCVNMVVNGWLSMVVHAIGWFVGMVVKMQDFMLTEIAHIPIASIDGVDVNVVQVIAMYAIIVACAVWANRKILKDG